MENCMNNRQAGPTILPLHIHDNQNGLDYTLHGDYYFPDFPEAKARLRTYGKLGRARLNYLKNHRPCLYSHLILSGRLNDHLADTDEQANDRMEQMIAQMVRQEGITEALKAADQMEWVRRMNAITHTAEEFILAELIFI